jgi:hypothetical protein
MYNCDHCQKKYKRSWHQARHSQMKHENSNASTATTSSAGTPPTPEINGNIISNVNNNYNYQQLQQVPQMPSQQPLTQDLNQLSQSPQHLHHPHQNVSIPQAVNNWNQVAPQPIQQPIHQPPSHQHHAGYEAATEMNPKGYAPPPGMPQQERVVHNGEYVNYAINEQYSNKFEQVQAAPPVANPAPNPYDSWVSFEQKKIYRNYY